MAGTTDFLPFATGGIPNVQPQADYVIAPERTAGFQAGIAESAKLNKVWRQGSFVAAAIAKFVADNLNINVADDGDLTTFITNLEAALLASIRSSLTVGPYILPAQYVWDVDTPPGADVALNAGDSALISFTSKALVPLKIATVPGIYTISQVITENSATNVDIGLLPNNITYAGAFTRYAIESGDLELTAFGSATAPATFTLKTVAPYLSSLPTIQTELGLDQFFIDVFNGPGGGFDVINDIGPCMVDYTISTHTAAKMIKTTSGIVGGAAASFSQWVDTTTPWTSLGTMKILQGPPTPTQTGKMIVKRLF